MPRDCVMTTGLRWPMEAAGSVENATAFPSAPWKSLRDSHSSHRPGYEGIESKALNCPPNRGNSSPFFPTSIRAGTTSTRSR